MYIGVDFIVRGLASVDYLWVPGKEEHLKEGRPFTMEPNSSFFYNFIISQDINLVHSAVGSFLV